MSNQNPSSPPETLGEVMSRSPMEEETTPRVELITPTSQVPTPTRTRARARAAARNRQETDPTDPEPTDVAEATGFQTGVTHQTRRPRSSSPRPSSRRRPSVRDVVGDLGDEDVGSAEKTARVVNSLAEAGQAGAQRKGTATAANWEEFLTILFGFLSMVMVWWMVAGFDVPKDEQESLMLTEDEAEGLARPMSRIIARSWVNASFGKNILGASDYVVLAITLAEYARRTYPYLRRRMGSMLPSRPRPRPVAPAPAPKETPNGRVSVDQAAGPAWSGPVILPNQAT